MIGEDGVKVEDDEIDNMNRGDTLVINTRILLIVFSSIHWKKKDFHLTDINNQIIKYIKSIWQDIGDKINSFSEEIEPPKEVEIDDKEELLVFWAKLEILLIILIPILLLNWIKNINIIK